ncbi:MAG: DUF5677 domain-containing protein [Atribacterota bacterium]|nr:DUF5677 domain-containing protein [Atribacterota bacterium]MDD4362810.1 DUF5677 domain-containing protein [Atribacterota bacterium]
MKYNLDTFLKLSDKYLKYSFMLYPISLKDVNLKLQHSMMQSHQSNTDTIFSIRKIIEIKKVNDVFCLSRSLFESIVNMGIIMSGKIENAEDRFYEYQYVEAYRTFQHLKRIEPDFVNKVYKHDTVNIITKGRNNFVLKYGNLNNWCGLNMIERVNLIDKVFPPTCSFDKIYEYLYCQVYRKGSNAIHRTFTGLGRANIIRIIELNGSNYISPMADIGNLELSCIHSLAVYLSSIRFLGYLLVGKKNSIETYYQEEIARIFEGKE